MSDMKTKIAQAVQAANQLTSPEKRYEAPPRQEHQVGKIYLSFFVSCPKVS